MKLCFSIPSIISYGVVANILAAAIPLTLLELSDGEAIRPMGHTMLMLLWALIATCILIPKAIVFMVVSKRWIAGLIGLALALFPLPTSILVFRWIVDFKGFILKE